MKPWYEEKNAPNPGHVLCSISEIEVGEVKEFEFGDSVKHLFRLMVYRETNFISAFINRCPHFSVPLNMNCGDFFTSDKGQFRCCHHYAKFDKRTGACTEGPCEGGALTAVPIKLVKDQLQIGDAP